MTNLLTTKQKKKRIREKSVETIGWEGSPNLTEKEKKRGKDRKKEEVKSPGKERLGLARRSGEGLGEMLGQKG